MSTDATVAHLLALARECAHRRANEANWLGLKTALREALDLGEPVAWDVYIASQQHGYLVDSLDDPQLIDDLTNTDAVATPLYAPKAKP